MSQNSAWEGDLLNRKEEGEFLVDYLIKRYENNKQEPFVLNINAEWGFGKSYFIKNLANELDTKKHPVVYFDAWKNDYTNQPLLAFISELNSSLSPYFNNSRKAKSLFNKTVDCTKNILIPIISKKLTGMAVDEIKSLGDDNEEDTNDESTTNNVDDADNDIENGVTSIISNTTLSILEEHKNIQSSIDMFKKNMLDLLKYIEKNLESKKLPMFVFIDELDRCRPNYAIELLENIKHIFDIEGIIFIIATDSKQLSHSINAVYGNNFASERYLKRFFNQEYNMKKPDNYAFANYLFNEYKIANHDKLFSPLNEKLYEDKNINIELFSLYSSSFKLGLRDQEQIMIVLYSIILTWKASESIHLGYLLFLIILKHQNDDLFNEFIEYVKSNDYTRLNKSLERIKTDKEIAYKTMADMGDEYRQTPEHRPIIELVVTYISSLQKNSDNLKNVSKSKDSDYKIIDKLTRELPNSYYSGEKRPAHPIDKYHNLILQAGQFS